MNVKLAIFLLCLAVTGYLIGCWDDAFGAEFTVDTRSFYHVGASALISGTMTAVAMTSPAAKEDKTLRRALVFGGCMAIGLAKEYGVDSYADGGDIFFNGVGCLLGAYGVEGISAYMSNNTVGVVSRW